MKDVGEHELPKVIPPWRAARRVAFFKRSTNHIYLMESLTRLCLSTCCVTKSKMCRLLVKTYEHCPGTNSPDFQHCIASDGIPCKRPALSITERQEGRCGTYGPHFQQIDADVLGNCYHCRSLPPPLLEWLSSELDSGSDFSMEHINSSFSELLISRDRPSRHVYNLCHEILATKIWPLEPLLARPLLDILCKRYSDEAIMRLFSDEQRLQTATTGAKILYAKYLHCYHLISVQLKACVDPAAQNEPSPQGPRDFDDTVCLRYHLRSDRISSD